MNTVVAKVRSIQGPEMMSNGGKKFYVALDDGATIVTFSERCKNELLKGMDTDVEFLLDGPVDTSPRILRAVRNNIVLYDREASAARANGGSSGQVTLGPAPAQADRPFYQDETTRAVEFAVQYLSAWNAAVVAKGGDGLSNDLLTAKLIDLSAIIHNLILDLRTPTEPPAEQKIETIPAGPWT